jgi:DNA-binding response OmpR family regulator
MGEDKHLLPLEMTIGGSTLFANDVTRVLVVNQQVIALTPTEYALLKLLLQQPGTPVSFEALIQAAFPADSPERAIGSKLLARHITNIRPKLWETPLNIHAVINFGYVLRLSDTPAHVPHTNPPVPRKKSKDGEATSL